MISWVWSEASVNLLAVQSRTLTYRLKTTQTCELAKSGKRGAVKEMELLNYMIIIPLCSAFVKPPLPVQSRSGMLKWRYHGDIFKDTQGMVEAGSESGPGNV